MCRVNFLLLTGYGPFSHVFNQMCTKTFPGWNVCEIQSMVYTMILLLTNTMVFPYKVESAAVVMLRHLIKENDLDEPLEDNGINEEERNFIYSLINHRNPVPDEKVIELTVILHWYVESNMSSDIMYPYIFLFLSEKDSISQEGDLYISLDCISHFYNCAYIPGGEWSRQWNWCSDNGFYCSRQLSSQPAL